MNIKTYILTAFISEPWLQTFQWRSLAD